MNDYSQRSKFYNFEYVTTDDFPLIRSILKMGIGPVIEIPCGAGRLLKLHSEHKRNVFMVDLEPRMVEQCRRDIFGNGLEQRISCFVGNMKEWISPEKGELIIVPRGGLQLLINRDEIQTTLNNFYQNLKINGVMYLDIADPWYSSDKNNHLLPEFMRFSKSDFLYGESEFSLQSPGLLTRSFISERHKDHISVDFKFSMHHDEEVINYEGIYRWERIKFSDLMDDLHMIGFVVKNVYQNYYFQNYEPGSSRIICIAQKKE